MSLVPKGLGDEPLEERPPSSSRGAGGSGSSPIAPHLGASCSARPGMQMRPDMDQRTSGLRAVLSSPLVYDLLQNLLGADGLRREYVRQFIRPAPGARILDIGCGTGAILKYLPLETDYEGYDMAPEYVEYARRKYPGRGRFRCERVSRLSVPQAHHFDFVLASALLHHLNDEEARDLFTIAAEALEPQGVLITYDNVYVERQSRLARYVISRDRGQHVRTPSQYETLARSAFARVQTSTRHDLLRIPYTHFFMRCSLPIASGSAGVPA